MRGAALFVFDQKHEADSWKCDDSCFCQAAISAMNFDAAGPGASSGLLLRSWDSISLIISGVMQGGGGAAGSELLLGHGSNAEAEVIAETVALRSLLEVLPSRIW